MLTGQFSGAVSAISFRGVPPGMYVVTVLVYIEATLNSSVVHTEHVQVTMDVPMETSKCLSGDPLPGGQMQC